MVVSLVKEDFTGDELVEHSSSTDCHKSLLEGQYNGTFLRVTSLRRPSRSCSMNRDAFATVMLSRCRGDKEQVLTVHTHDTGAVEEQGR